VNRILIFLAVPLLGACGLHGNKPPTLPPVARPLAEIPRAAPVDLAKASDLAEAAHESNRRLRGSLEDAVAAASQSRRKVHLLQEQKALGEQDLRTLTDTNDRIEASLTRADALVVQQAGQIGMLKRDLAENSGKVAAGELEKAALRSQVANGEEQVARFETANRDLTLERDKAKVEVEVVKGSLKTEVMWKWRFFRWALAMTVLVVLWIVSRFYRLR